MGSSIAMIDRHYGHLARDSREHAVSLVEPPRLKGPWTLGVIPIPDPPDEQNRASLTIPRPISLARSRRCWLQRLCLGSQGSSFA